VKQLALVAQGAIGVFKHAERQQHYASNRHGSISRSLYMMQS